MTVHQAVRESVESTFCAVSVRRIVSPSSKFLAFIDWLWLLALCLSVCLFVCPCVRRAVSLPPQRNNVRWRMSAMTATNQADLTVSSTFPSWLPPCLDAPILRLSYSLPPRRLNVLRERAWRRLPDFNFVRSFRFCVFFVRARSRYPVRRSGVDRFRKQAPRTRRTEQRTDIRTLVPRLYAWPTGHSSRLTTVVCRRRPYTIR